MLALRVVDVKQFMGKLLLSNTFDQFLIWEAELFMANAVKISGKRNRFWYDDAEWEALEEKEYLKWLELRPMVYQMIKGNKTPLRMKLVLSLASNQVEKIAQLAKNAIPSDQIGGLLLQIHFEKEELSLITGVSLKSFQLGKTLEETWDDSMKQYLKHHEIAFEER
ncbi:MAG: hypothetical protein PWP24_806 [Clostridiales bacterium]|nr:hypothetical protein [Clostridiales bacterium]